MLGWAADPRGYSQDTMDSLSPRRGVQASQGENSGGPKPFIRQHTLYLGSDIPEGSVRPWQSIWNTKFCPSTLRSYVAHMGEGDALSMGPSQHRASSFSIHCLKSQLCAGQLETLKRNKLLSPRLRVTHPVPSSAHPLLSHWLPSSQSPPVPPSPPQQVFWCQYFL